MGRVRDYLTSEPLRTRSFLQLVLIGLIALPFAPETKGQPLPEEEGSPAH